MIGKKTEKIFVLLSVLIICTCLPLILQVVAAPDGYEPNGDFATATTLTKGTHSGLSLDPYYEYDYYKINLNAGENMSVVLWNMTADLNLYLYDTSQNPISSSTNSGTTAETVVLTQAPTTGYYFIRISTYYSSWSNYTLNITDVLDDSFEENDNLATAPTWVKGSYGNLVCADADYYNISLTSGENLTAQVSFANGAGYFDLILFAPNGTEIQSMLQFSKYGLGNLVLRNAFSTGLYSVKINPSTISSWGNYSLLLADANDDIFEDNDGFTTAANLTKGSNYGNLSLYDPDYYNVSLSANANISITLTRVTGSGSFNMSLFDVDQTTELWYANNFVSSGKVFIAHAPSTGNYSLRIIAAGADVWGNYSLSLGNLADDLYENADSFATAQELSKSTTSYSNLMLYDADFYKVSLSIGQNVSITFPGLYIIYGSLNISLYAPDQTTLLFQINDVDSYSYYYGSPAVLAYNVQSSGFYYLKVVPNQHSYCSNYAIVVGDACDDRYENNDVVGSAAELVKFVPYSLALFDDDYFKIYLGTGDSARVLLTRAYGPGTFGVSIYASDNQTILNSTVNIEAKGMGDIRITDVANAGYYLIKVRSYAGAYGNYTLLIGNVFSQSSPGGIAGFPIEWVLLWGSGILAGIFVWNRRKSIKYVREEA